MAGSIKLAPLMTEIKVDIANFKSDMEKAATIGTREADRISKKLSTTAKVGDMLSNAGSALTKGLTVPIVGAGAAVTKMAVDFESNFAKVSTLLDSNVVDFGIYKNQLLDASSESKVAVDEFSEAVYSSISAGVDQTKAIDFTTQAMKLAKGGFTDGAKAVDVLTTAINGYNMRAEDSTKISDLLITTQNLGKTTVDELASSMGTVIPVASSVNYGIEELSASYAQLTKNGIATAESGTYLKAMLSELGKSGSITDKTLRELTGKGFAQLKSEGTSTTDILQMLSDAAAKDGKTLKDMFGSVEAGSAALVLAKGNGAEYNEMLAAMGNSAGATQAAFEKMDATPAEKLKGSLNELKNEGIRFGSAFVPVIDKVSDVLKKSAKAFSGLSDEQQQNVIKWGAVLAATGPVLKVLGGGISTFTKLSSVMGGASKALGIFGSAQSAAAAAAGTASAAVGSAGLTGSMVGLLGVCAPIAAGAAAVGTGLYAVHESSKLAKRGVNEASEEMSLMERVIATLSGTETHSREELEKLGIVTKDYGNTVSGEFSDAMDKARQKVMDFNTYLTDISLDNVITSEESKGVISRVEGMCNEAIDTIQVKKEEAQKHLKELFIAEDGVIDESEQKVLNALGKSYDEQQKKVQEHVDAIARIKQQANEQSGKLTENQIQELSKHYEKVSQIELETTAKTKEELLVAERDFQSQIATMNANQASKLLKQKSKERDDEIKIIKGKYDEGINQLKVYMENASEAEKEGYQKQIDNLDDAKKKQIQKEQDKYDKFYDMAIENNKNLEEAINKYNGKVLSMEDKHNQDLLSTCKERYLGLNEITKSGCYELFDTNDMTYKRVAVVVDKKTHEVIGFHENMSNMTAGYSREMANEAVKMSNSQDASYKRIISAASLYVDYASHSIVNANGVAVASLNNLKQHTDGTRRGIIDINGTPYRIQVDSDGTISELRAIGDEADYAARSRTITFIPDYSQSTSAQKWMEQAGIRSFNYNGLDNVPYDGYSAYLHKGERVLTAEENKVYSQGGSGIDYSKMEQCMKSAVKELAMYVGEREFGRVIDNRLRERGIIS